jgi:error-prone DNA polymerase
VASAPDPTLTHRRDDQLAVRLGLASIKGISPDTATAIVRERVESGLFLSPADLVRRVGLGSSQLESLASAGALGDWGHNRRESLWLAGHTAGEHPQFLPHTSSKLQVPLFEALSAKDIMIADRVFTGVSPGDHPVRYLREWLGNQGVATVTQMSVLEPGRRIWVAGLVTHRQRPSTAKGVTFLSLEDETGVINVICGVGFWRRYRDIVRDSAAVIIRGILERSPEGVISVVADAVESLPVGVLERSRDFR